MQDPVEQRLVELEKKIAFGDLAIAELNATVTGQYKRIEALEREIRLLKDKMTSGDFVKKQEDEEPPPHW
jgi:uncharacterized coiled-coil protein SlyX